MATKKLTLDDAHALLAAMGLPVADDSQPGFQARAWGGRAGNRQVDAAVTVEVHYRLGRTRNATSADLRELPDIRQQFQHAVDNAPEYGYTIDWNPNLALMHLTRAAS